jgi:hypothetical protein
MKWRETFWNDSQPRVEHRDAVRMREGAARHRARAPSSTVEIVGRFAKRSAGMPDEYAFNAHKYALDALERETAVRAAFACLLCLRVPIHQPPFYFVRCDVVTLACPRARAQAPHGTKAAFDAQAVADAKTRMLDLERTHNGPATRGSGGGRGALEGVSATPEARAGEGAMISLVGDDGGGSGSGAAPLDAVAAFDAADDALAPPPSLGVPEASDVGAAAED